ncbi:MAG: ABC transporter permease subunit [Acetobacteraceae bacterium]|nr:ABC transporter permease subunit [Acetobacteraceae bacterium]
MKRPGRFRPLALARVGYVYRREMSAYFLSPVAYVVIAVYLVLSGYFFSMILLATHSAEMRGTLGDMSLVFLFVAPVLTMRLLADERRTGTDELLFTSPLSTADIVAGKYLASLSVFLVMLALTGVYPIILMRYGQPDMGTVLSGYLGVFLLGAVFLAVGLFASSLTDNQVVAGMIGFGMLLLLWVLGWAGQSLENWLGRALAALSVLDRFSDFNKGVLDLSNAVFYLSYIAGFCFLTVFFLDRRRWAR